MDQAAPDLVARLLAGDDRAWREYIRAYGRLILAAGRRAGLSASDLDEAFQATCVAVCKSLPSLREPARLSTWTYSIAYRSAVDLRRRTGPVVSAHDPERGSLFDSLAGDEPSPEDVAIRIDQSERLHAGLAALSSSCRDLIRALYLQSPPPSYQEISSQLQVPIGSIGPTRARCLEKLKQALSRVSNRSRTGTNGQNRKRLGSRRSGRAEPRVER